MHFGVVDHIRASALTTDDRRPPSWNRITDSTHAPPVGNGIYAVNSKMISMATAAILKFLSLKRLLFSVFAVSMATAGILKFPSLKTIYTHAIQHFY
jgi:hypothetical protein